MEAARRGERCSTEYCYDSQRNTNLVEEKLHKLYNTGPPDENESSASSAAVERNILVKEVYLSTKDSIFPSQILADESKVKLACSPVDPCNHAQLDSNDLLREKADVLLKKLRQ